MSFVPSYRWNLTDLEKVDKNHLKVFSCFACGGGSTMGYKLAGFDVIGANEIDPKMAWHYKTNHNPKYYYLEDIRVFNKRKDLPTELYGLDILDGSPPCSSFSLSGNRAADWGKKKVFREGQKEQVLDDLFFEFIALAKELQPKVVVAENVKGLIMGNAKGYVKQIISEFGSAGYQVQLFLLNAATMGVPQKRERVFFVCSRNDLNFSKLKIEFNQKPIVLRDALKGLKDDGIDRSSSKNKHFYDRTKPGSNFKAIHPRGSLFNSYKLSPNDVSPTILAGIKGAYHWDRMRSLSQEEACAIGSYPFDYKFLTKTEFGYLIGMSVPPLMAYGLANEIYKQWLKSPILG